MTQTIMLSGQIMQTHHLTVPAATLMLAFLPLTASSLSARIKPFFDASRASTNVPLSRDKAQDCLISGPHIDNVPGGPVIVDTGSAGSTNGAGCDGCSIVLSKFDVTWPAQGQAIVGGLGQVISNDVLAGSKSTININHAVGDESGFELPCDTTGPVGWTATQNGVSSTIGFRCHECQ